MNEPPPLQRRLGSGDAVVVGLGSMIGAGVFAAFAPAAREAGSALLAGLALAAAVAACNATSSARLAKRHPESGGTYVYGRERLGPFWGFAAGWAFVAGKTASCAAMALTAGAYAFPSNPRPFAVAATVALTLVDAAGVRKTAGATRALVAVTLATLAVVVLAALAGGSAELSRAVPRAAEPLGVGRAAALLFFAFAGYARLATLGEEVRDPSRTIPPAVAISHPLAAGVYALVAVAALAALGPDRLASSVAPLSDAVRAGRFDAASALVRIGAVAAALGVLVSLLAGVARTMFAMARDGEAPRGLAAVGTRSGVPARAQLLVGSAVTVVVAIGDVRSSIGFSSFAVLLYYAITNAAAWTLGGRLRAVAAAGLAGCLAVAASVPLAALVAGAAVVAAGPAARLVLRRE